MNFMTVTPELIYSEIAFLSLVKDKVNLPQLEDLIIINNRIHIILQYFKYKPFIVKTTPLPYSKLTIFHNFRHFSQIFKWKI